MLIRYVVLFLNALLAASALIEGWKEGETVENDAIYMIKPYYWGKHSPDYVPCIAIRPMEGGRYLVAQMTRNLRLKHRSNVPAQKYFDKDAKLTMGEGKEEKEHNINEYSILTRGHVVECSPVVMKKLDDTKEQLHVLDHMRLDLESKITSKNPQSGETDVKPHAGGRRIDKQAGRVRKLGSNPPSRRPGVPRPERGPDRWPPRSGVDHWEPPRSQSGTDRNRGSYR